MIYKTYSIGTVGPSEQRDVDLLVPRVRPSDLEELAKASKMTMQEGLQGSFDNAKISLTIKDLKGMPVAMLGLGWMPNPREGLAWLIAQDLLDEFGLLFLEASRDGLKTFMQGHDVIFNYIYEGNTQSIKWLEWLGFEQTEEIAAPRSEGEKFVKMAQYSDPATRDLYLNRDWASYSASRSFDYSL